MNRQVYVVGLIADTHGLLRPSIATAFAGVHAILHAGDIGAVAKLKDTPRSQLLAFKGGQNKGDPCEALAYHGFNGLEPEVVRQVAAWILAK